MRPKGIIGLLIVLVLLGTAFYFFSNRFIESTLEDVGSAMLGARVEIDNLDFSLIGLSVSLERLQATNPNDTWKNIIETGRLAFDMEVAPLAHKKIIIRDVIVADIRIGTHRETDGIIEKTEDDEEPGWMSEASSSLKQRLAEAPVLNLDILKKKINVDSLLNAFDIQTLAKINQSRADAEITFKKWDKNLAEFRPQKDLDKVAKQLRELKSQELSDLKDLISAADKTKKIVTTLKRLKKEFTLMKKLAVADLQRVNGTFSQIDNWVANDFNAIKSKANIGEFNASNIGRMLFGNVVVTPILKWLGYVKMVRKYMPPAQQFMAAGKVEKPPRFAGQDIKFPLLGNQPEFLLENLLVSAATNQADTSRVLWVSGEVHGIASQPQIYGEPLTFDLKVDVPGSNAYKVSGQFDHTTDQASDRLQVAASGIRFGNIALPEKPYLPDEIVANTGNINARLGLIGDEVEVKIEFWASPVEFIFNEGKTNNDVIAQVTRGVFDSINKLTFTAGISGPANALRLNINSNIDAILAKRIKGVVGESARLARVNIRNKLEEKIVPQKQESLAFIKKNNSRINNKIEKLQQSINKQIKSVESKKKELEAKIKRKKEQGVKNIKGKLKDFFKKK